MSAEKKDDSTSSEPIEGPEMPPSLPSTSTRSNGSDSPSPVRSPRRGRRERSPLRDYGRHTDRRYAFKPVKEDSKFLIFELIFVPFNYACAPN